MSWSREKPLVPGQWNVPAGSASTHNEGPESAGERGFQAIGLILGTRISGSLVILKVTNTSRGIHQRPDGFVSKWPTIEHETQLCGGTSPPL